MFEMSSVCCNRPVGQPQQKQPNSDCAIARKPRRDSEDMAKSVIQPSPINNLEPTGPLPNEIFELLNEFWRPEVGGSDQHMLNGKIGRRNTDTPSTEDQADEDKGTLF